MSPKRPAWQLGLGVVLVGGGPHGPPVEGQSTQVGVDVGVLLGEGKLFNHTGFDFNQKNWVYERILNLDLNIYTSVRISSQ